MTRSFRTEHDSLGPVDVSADALDAHDAVEPNSGVGVLDSRVKLDGGSVLVEPGSGGDSTDDVVARSCVLRFGQAGGVVEHYCTRKTAIWRIRVAVLDMEVQMVGS